MDNCFEEDNFDYIEDPVNNIEVNIPEYFIRNIKFVPALSEYYDWVEYLKKELEDMIRDVLRNGISDNILDGKDNL